MLKVSDSAAAERSTARGAREVRLALWRVYRRTLYRYVTPDDGILARSLVEETHGWRITEPCPLNTAEVLKALFLLESHGIPGPIDASALMDRLVRDHMDRADYSTTALALWAAALGHHQHRDLLWSMLFERLPSDASASMPLAWALAAVCQYAGTTPDQGDITPFARDLANRLLANQDESSGLFYASARREGWLRRRRQDATLSSQTYPILALAAYYTVFGVHEALSAAVRCAERLRSLQGPQGQWWRRYRTHRGVVQEHYPVFSVNQDGAIPAAFSALQRALGDRRYDEAIEQGLKWEDGRNELGQSLIDEPWCFVAQAIEKEGDALRFSKEMYGYQPARCLYAILSDPAWTAEVLS